MKVATILSTIALLATSVAAAPRKAPEGHGLAARRAARIERRAAERNRSSHPIDKTGSAEVTTENATRTQIEYSSNWAGAVIEEPPSGTFTAVVGTFTVPSVSVPSGESSSEEWAASAWVGIDGDTYQNAILQTGIDFIIYEGETYYDAWYEWYPDYAYDFDFEVSEGDVIALTVESTSDSSGTVTIENVSSGDSVSTSLTPPEATATLGGQNAEWIVEDFESNSELVNFADFDTVVFTGASSTTSDGTTADLDSAEIIEIESDGEILTEVTIDSDSQVTITYSG